MAFEVAENVPVRETPCTDQSLQQVRLKSSLRFFGPAATHCSSEANSREGTMPRVHSCTRETAPGTSSDPSNYLSLEGSEQGDQVITQDLCHNFVESWVDGSERRTETEHPWKKTRATPSGHKLCSRPSRDHVPVATVPVSRHGVEPPEDTDGQCLRTRNYMDPTGDHRLQIEGANRWAVKRKADAVSGITYNDHRDMTRMRNKFHSFHLLGTLANRNEVNAPVPFNFMQSLRGQWAPPSQSPSEIPTPAKSSDFYGLQACTTRGILKRALTCDASKDPKPFKAHQSRPTTNMLKLPKDMQGRWSSERYKSAQLKLIDIMHERRAQPGRPIRRPALRGEARKHIGDTGLLDHLLKHMTDTVVSTGERFRRRHNAEGAMEYWLEDASLMELRKAAGIEDPSWIPPQGWKPGDKSQGGFWEIGRGLSSSESAEMSQLKDTVEMLRREMKFLFGKLKELKQMGILQIVDMKDRVGVKQLETVHEAYLKPSEDLNKKIEDQEEEKITASGSTTLDWQLADIRKEVSRMQSDLQCILKLLGYQQHVRASSGSSPQGKPSTLLSAGEEVLSVTNMSETLNPASSPRGVDIDAHLESQSREFASVNSGTSSSTDTAGLITKDTFSVTDNPECQVKLCPRSREASSAIWLNLTTKSSVQWDDHTNPSPQDQLGMNASTTCNSPEGSPVNIKFSGAVRPLAKDCPVVAVMEGMFGCMVHTKHEQSIQGQNHIGTVNVQHPQLRQSTPDCVWAVDSTAVTPARKPVKCTIGNASAFAHRGPPLSLSLSLTLGSQVRSDINNGADTIVKHP